MCTAQAQAAFTPQGRRNADGSLTPDRQLGVGQKWMDRHPAYRPPSAQDVPLGTGQLDVAATGIKNRRQRIAEALGET